MRYTYNDVILLSPSLLGLQAMLDSCTQYSVSHNIVFNSKKSAYTIIGKLHNTQPAPIYLGGTTLEYVTRFKYLGITFSSGRTLSVDTACIKRKFYSACNSVLSKLGSALEPVLLQLVHGKCLPL